MLVVVRTSSAVEPLPFSVTGEKLALVPGGSPEIVKLTGKLNPPVGLRVSVNEALEPAVTAADRGAAVTEKLRTVNLTVSVRTRLPSDAVITKV